MEREAVTAVPPVSLRSYDAKLHSFETSTNTGTETRVQQHFAEEVDINTIMRRYGVTRELPLGPATGIYGDFTGIADYADAVERVRGAQERFMALPADVRERFDNDPANLIAAAESMPEAEFTEMFSGAPAVEIQPVVAPPAAAP